MIRLFNEQLPNFFNEFYFNEDTNNFPKTQINKEKSGYDLKFALPGLKKEDVEIKVDKGIITVSYSNNEDNIFVGKFEKSYKLPSDVDSDKIKGKFEDGILSVDIPFKEELVTEKVINIT